MVKYNRGITHWNIFRSICRANDPCRSREKHVEGLAYCRQNIRLFRCVWDIRARALGYCAYRQWQQLMGDCADNGSRSHFVVPNNSGDYIEYEKALKEDRPPNFRWAVVFLWLFIALGNVEIILYNVAVLHNIFFTFATHLAFFLCGNKRTESY